MSVTIYTDGELTIDHVTTDQKKAIMQITDGWGEPAFCRSPRTEEDDSITVWLNDEIVSGSAFECGVVNPISKLVGLAEKEGLKVNGEIRVSSDWQDYNNIVIFVNDNVVRQANSEIAGASTDELLGELKQRGVAVGDPEKDKKIEILMHLLENAVGELRNSAEDWYQDEILDLVGTNEEELRSLGFSVIP